MTVRVAGGITYTLAYDRENRLVGVAGPSTGACFVYDAAGHRVLEPRTAFTVGGETTAYIGGVYEHTDTKASTSTYAGSVMRRSGYAGDNGAVTVPGDHLGSTAVLVDASGAVVARQ
jgi:hypothetical protein